MTFVTEGCAAGYPRGNEFLIILFLSGLGFNSFRAIRIVVQRILVTTCPSCGMNRKVTMVVVRVTSLNTANICMQPLLTCDRTRVLTALFMDIVRNYRVSTRFLTLGGVSWADVSSLTGDSRSLV